MFQADLSIDPTSISSSLVCTLHFDSISFKNAASHEQGLTCLQKAEDKFHTLYKDCHVSTKFEELKDFFQRLCMDCNISAQVEELKDFFQKLYQDCPCDASSQVEELKDAFAHAPKSSSNGAYIFENGSSTERLLSKVQQKPSES